MLEHPCLWLSAPTDAGPFARGRGKARAVLDAESRQVLGHFTLHPKRRIPWGRGRHFTAYEAPDASLVFSGWAVGWLSRTTAVQDADSRLVAVVRGDYLLTPAGGFLAMHHREARGGAGRFVGPTGAALSDWRIEGVGTLIRFHPAVYEEPFVKMGLLAAVLEAG
jgi:hypothetical protein